MVFIQEGQGPDYERKHAYSYDSSSRAPELTISYTVPGNQPYHYITAIDLSTLPSGYSLTTDNIETATFNFHGTSDCNNDFGISSSSYGCPDIYTNGFIRFNRLD